MNCPSSESAHALDYTVETLDCCCNKVVALVKKPLLYYMLDRITIFCELSHNYYYF